MLKNIIEQGTGKQKADLVLKNGKFVNVFTAKLCKRISQFVKIK